MLAHSMVVDYWELVSIWGPIGVSLFTFAISLVPFVSPSNALMAMLIAMSFPNMNKLAIGLSVALGATLAKTVHFTAFYGLGKVVDKKAGRKRVMSRYGRLIMYIMNIIAAATPIPDEWIVIPLGLTQASFIWFATTYFIGKLVITIPSAYIGH
ncbi:MAG: VTT domain-containing protein, partial [Candidatus Nezhaarchaeales archaeon]